MAANRGVGAENRAYHYGSNGDEGIIHPARVLDITTLERQLKTATAHAETHRIHVDVVIKSGTMPRLWEEGGA
jgi:D-serine deaminase-like pyridoxal phosphate-dependent protein